MSPQRERPHEARNEHTDRAIDAHTVRRERNWRYVLTARAQLVEAAARGALGAVV